MTAASLFQKVIDWLRAGYPAGVPGPDRVPLLALLRTTPLTEDQIKDIVRAISEAESHAEAGHEIDRDEIERFIADHVRHDAGPDDIKRVAAKLAAAGWPLAGVDEDAAGD